MVQYDGTSDIVLVQVVRPKYICPRLLGPPVFLERGKRKYVCLIYLIFFLWHGPRFVFWLSVLSCFIAIVSVAAFVAVYRLCSCSSCFLGRLTVVVAMLVVVVVVVAAAAAEEERIISSRSSSMFVVFVLDVFLCVVLFLCISSTFLKR